MNGYVSILSQGRKVNKLSNCQRIIIDDDFIAPYVIIDGGKDEYILGRYKSLERAKEVLCDIHASNSGKYEMPLE